MLKINLAV